MARSPGPAYELTGSDGRFRLSGVATLGNARAVLEHGSRAFAGLGRVELDLSGVTAADSAGLAVLLTWVERARSAGQVLVFGALPAQMLAIARVCGVETLLGAAATPRG